MQEGPAEGVQRTAQALPQWSSYYDYYFSLGDVSQRDEFLNLFPQLGDFFDAREDLFPDIGELTKIYATLPGNDVRQGYLAGNPQLQAYWDWRNDFIQRNPDVATLISDSPKYQTEEFQQQAAAASGQPQFTRQEWRNQLGAWVDNLVLDYADGEDLPPAVTEQLRDLAWNYGFQGDVERLVENINSSP